MEKIIFYNHFHNGDLHHSRNFVKYFIKNLSKTCEFYYAHENSPLLLEDIPNCKHLNIKDLRIDHQADIIKNDNTIFINTWIGQKKFHYLNFGFGCSFVTNLKLWEDIFNFFGISLPPENDILIPSIDLDLYSNMKAAPAESILFCNNDPKSGQAELFNMTNLIFDYANKNSDYTCIISNHELLTKKMPSNVVSINDFCTNSLNHIGLFSERCGMIVGRTSGPFCFTLTKKNYSLKKTFVSFAHGNNNDAFWHTSSHNKYHILKRTDGNLLSQIRLG